MPYFFASKIGTFGRIGLQVDLHHALPGGPVVAVVGVPDVHAAWDTFGLEDSSQMAAFLEAMVVPAAGEEVGVLAVAVELP